MEKDNCKILAITTAHNEDYQLEQWYRFFKNYKSDILYHVIVNNGSCDSYSNKIKQYFTESTIINLSEDQGITGGFNTGIRFALKTDCTHILFIIQDMFMDKGSIKRLCSILESCNDVDVISPIIYYGNHSNIIREYGGRISKLDFSVNKYYKGEGNNNNIPLIMNVEFVCGGVYMVRRDFFQKNGLYDETIFLYGDETDLFLRAKGNGLKLSVTKKVECWHEHVYRDCQNSKKLPTDEALYFTGRNYFYLIKKHGNYLNLIFGLLKIIYYIPYNILRYALRSEPQKFIKLYYGYLQGIGKQNFDTKSVNKFNFSKE